MSYYKYITGLYKSDWPELNRTLRSSSVPRRVPDLDTGRFTRGTSISPSAFYNKSFFSHPATPFSDRSTSVPRDVLYFPEHRSTSYTDIDYTDKGRFTRGTSISPSAFYNKSFSVTPPLHSVTDPPPYPGMFPTFQNTGPQITQTLTTKFWTTWEDWIERMLLGVMLVRLEITGLPPTIKVQLTEIMLQTVSVPDTTIMMVTNTAEITSTHPLEKF